MNFGVLFLYKEERLRNGGVYYSVLLSARRLWRANDSVNYRASMTALNSATGRSHFFRSSGFGR